jgi:hypothetical protein
VFWRLVLAHRKARNRAYELYQKGFFPPDISSELKVPLRTCQRWVKEFSQQNGVISENQENQESIVSKSINHSSEIIDYTSKSQYLPKLKFQNQDWFDAALELSNELLEVHTELRRKLVELMKVKLGETDLNLRTIQGLSQVVCRHSEIEQNVIALSLLDTNRAFQLVERYGYLVIDPNIEEEQ